MYVEAGVLGGCDTIAGHCGVGCDDALSGSRAESFRHGSLLLLVERWLDLQFVRLRAEHQYDGLGGRNDGGLFD